MKKRRYLIEACLEGLNQALRAEKQGADRIELCAHLDLDGLTPNRKTIKEVYHKCKIPVRVIIRPRAGNFIYSNLELEDMKASISFCKKIGVEGVVFGITTDKGMLDIEKIEELTSLAFPLKVTIHKAIDAVLDPISELEKLMSIKGISAVLTSGKAETWFDGQELIKKLIKKSGKQIEIIACGKVTNDNVEIANKVLNSSAYHGKLIVGNLK